MSGKDLSEAMGGITDEKIEGAIHAYEKKGIRRNVWFRVAAVAAMLAIVLTVTLWPRRTENGEIITAPGIMRVYGYELGSGTEIENMISYELTDSVVAHTEGYTFAMNRLYGLPMTLQVSEEAFAGKEITLDVSVDHGGFYGDIHSEKYKTDKKDTVASLPDVDFGNQFTVENGETIFWRTREVVEEAEKAGMHPYDYLETIGNVIHVEVIIRADGHIVGYTVVDIHYKEGFFAACVKETVSFPKVNGEFQYISEENVKQMIERNGDTEQE